MNIDVRSAVNSLVPNNASHIENEKITLCESVEIQPTEAEIDTEIVRLEKEFSDNEYARKRQAEYPSIQELVVALYDENDRAAIDAKMAEVKLKYPKQ